MDNTYIKIIKNGILNNKYDNYDMFRYKKYLKIKQTKMDKFYVTPKSKNQFYTFLKYAKNKNDLDLFSRLGKLLSKFLSSRYVLSSEYNKLLELIVQKKYNDEKVYDILRRKYILRYKQNTQRGGGLKFKISNDGNINFDKSKLQKEDKKMLNNISNYKISRDNKQSDFIYRAIKSYYKNKNQHMNIENILDIGCGNCKKTVLLGEKLGLSKQNIMGADLESWSEYNNTNRLLDKLNFQLIEENQPLPFNDNSIHCIVLSMVLHHVKNLDLLLQEVHRILHKDGIVYIEEHNALTDFDYILCDIEHGLYECVTRNEKNRYFNDYYAKYYDWIELTAIMRNYNFSYCVGDVYLPQFDFIITATKKHYAIYKK